MNRPLRIVELDALVLVLAPEAVIAAVREALVRHARGETVAPLPVQMLFESPPGDCHVKAGRFLGGDRFVVKIATGFYDNPKHGLAVNDGMMLVFDAQTGAPEAIIRDQGWLTSWRTAAAGALAAQAGIAPGVSMLGIVGTGHQARLQAEWAARHLGIRDIQLWGRTPEHAATLARELCTLGLQASAAPSVEALCETCRLLITCTPATTFLVPAAAVRPGTHIVALGADGPGKQELDPALLARAARIMVDDRDQCDDHGELSYALRQSPAVAENVVLVGDVLDGRSLGRGSETDITVADLTGIAATDVAIATLLLNLLTPTTEA